MKKYGFSLLMVVCLLVATQVSADVYAASNDSGESWIISETKIVSQEDVIVYTVDDERIADLSVCSKQFCLASNFGTYKVKGGLELGIYDSFLPGLKRVKPESIPYIKNA